MIQTSLKYARFVAFVEFLKNSLKIRTKEVFEELQKFYEKDVLLSSNKIN